MNRYIIQAGAAAAGLLREPLMQFFVVGAALFLVYAWSDEGLGGESRSVDEIVVGEAEIAGLESHFRRLWQRPPSWEELQALVEGWVREEILYREGLALGLDQNDPVIRKRVAQKVSFISEDLLATDPSEGEVHEWFSTHRDDYVQEPTFSFRQILIDDGTDEARARAAASAMRDGLANGMEPQALGAATLLPYELSLASAGDVARDFGDGFAAELLAMPPGEWIGPVASAYGAHLVQLTARDPGRPMELAEVRSRVERDLVRARQDEANEAFLNQLRLRYTITIVSELADRRPTNRPAGDRT